MQMDFAAACQPVFRVDCQMASACVAFWLARWPALNTRAESAGVSRRMKKTRIVKKG